MLIQTFTNISSFPMQGIERRCKAIKLLKAYNKALCDMRAAAKNYFELLAESNDEYSILIAKANAVELSNIWLEIAHQILLELD